MKSKRGQFFLIAAVVIIVVVVSVMTITNYTKTEENADLETLGDEMEIESGQVLDYWVSTGKSSEELTVLMEEFIDNYVDSLEDKKNIYFIFGNSDLVHFRGYQLLEPGECICLTMNNKTADERACSIMPESECTPAIISNIDGERITQNFIIDGGITSVRTSIKDQDYFTDIEAGENFYFIIWGNQEGEKHIVIGGN